MMQYAPKYDMAAMSSAYLGSVRYYAAMLAARRTMVDGSQCGVTHLWAHNHCRISSANGPQALVVPIDKVNYNQSTPMRDVMISNHGDWRHLHWGALFSAYGKSPFFDYIASDLEKIVKGEQKYLFDLNCQLQSLVVEFLDLPIDWQIADSVDGADLDLRGKVGEKKPDRLTIGDVQYYQLWASRNGFLPDLSILDLLCNTGRESIFTLLKMAEGL